MLKFMEYFFEIITQEGICHLPNNIETLERSFKLYLPF